MRSCLRTSLSRQGRVVVCTITRVRGRLARERWARGTVRWTAGVVAPDVNVEFLFKALDRSFGAAMLEWVVGELPPEKLAPTIRHSYALILKGAASDGWRGPLDVRLQESQACIQGAGFTL